MNEFISRESALDVLNKLARDNFTLQEAFSFYFGALHDAADGIKNIPTVDVAPVVHGHWVFRREMMYCSECAAAWDRIYTIDYNYCPNCGAKMDEEG